MICIQEFEIYKGESMYVVLPCELGGATEGYTFEDAVDMAADWLRIYALDELARGRELRNSSFDHEPKKEGGRIVMIAVDVSLEDVPAVTAAEAARRLGVSTARVAQLCAARELDSWKVGATRMVSEESIWYRLKTHPAPGRPKEAPVPASA